MSPDTGRQRSTATTSSATLSTSHFKRELSGLLSAVAEEHGLNWRSPSARGRAFEYWVAQLILDFESGFDGELSEVVMGSKNLGADLVFEDVGNRLLLICQCKYRRPQDEVAEADVNDFFNHHAHYQDRTWVMAMAPRPPHQHCAITASGSATAGRWSTASSPPPEHPSG